MISKANHRILSRHRAVAAAPAQTNGHPLFRAHTANVDHPGNVAC